MAHPRFCRAPDCCLLRAPFVFHSLLYAVELLTVKAFVFPLLTHPISINILKISTSEQTNSGGTSKILTPVCFRLSTEWYGVDIRPHCHAERVGATVCLFLTQKVLNQNEVFSYCTFTLACIRAEPYTCSNSYGAHSWRAHTPSVSPDSLSHPTDADGASIYAPLHAGCQTCSFLIARGEVFAALQRRCKTFISRGGVPPHARAQSPVARLWLFCGRGNWRWVLCAGNAVGDRSQEMPASSSATLFPFSCVSFLYY